MSSHAKVLVICFCTKKPISDIYQRLPVARIKLKKFGFKILQQGIEKHNTRKVICAHHLFYTTPSRPLPHHLVLQPPLPDTLPTLFAPHLN